MVRPSVPRTPDDMVTTMDARTVDPTAGSRGCMVTTKASLALHPLRDAEARSHGHYHGGWHRGTSRLVGPFSRSALYMYLVTDELPLSIFPNIPDAKPQLILPSQKVCEMRLRVPWLLECGYIVGCLVPARISPAASISERERKTPHDRAIGVPDSGQICHFSSAAERCFREDQTPRSELGALLLHYSLGSREDGDS